MSMSLVCRSIPATRGQRVGPAHEVRDPRLVEHGQRADVEIARPLIKLDLSRLHARSFGLGVEWFVPRPGQKRCKADAGWERVLPNREDEPRGSPLRRDATNRGRGRGQLRIPSGAWRAWEAWIG